MRLSSSPDMFLTTRKIHRSTLQWQIDSHHDFELLRTVQRVQRFDCEKNRLTFSTSFRFLDLSSRDAWEEMRPTESMDQEWLNFSKAWDGIKASGWCRECHSWTLHSGPSSNSNTRSSSARSPYSSLYISLLVCAKKSSPHVFPPKPNLPAVQISSRWFKSLLLLLI